MASAQPLPRQPGFWQWGVFSTTPLSCVVTEKRWLPANLSCLCLSPSRKTACFSLHTGVPGAWEMCVLVTDAPSVVPWNLGQEPRWARGVSAGQLAVCSPPGLWALWSQSWLTPQVGRASVPQGLPSPAEMSSLGLFALEKS